MDTFALQNLLFYPDHTLNLPGGSLPCDLLLAGSVVPALTISPPSVALAPGGASQQFTASTNGPSPDNVVWDYSPRLGEISSLMWTAEYADGAHRGLTFIFRASCNDDSDCAVDDPDAVIREAAWVPRAEAIERLEAVPFRRVAEPASKVLRGEVAEGSLWTYAPGDDDSDRLLAVIAGSSLNF